MSSDKQEASIPDQRAALKKYAKANGFRVIREYSDEAISGDDTLRRVSFRQMIDDASGKTFEAILCWDQDRFGRFDLIEAGRWIQPLREAGVFLQTIGQGRVDWNDFAGRIVYSVQQEAKHGFLRDLSRNTIRGLRSAAETGKALSSRPPIGYAVIDGRYAIEEQRAEIVRRLFREFIDGTSTGRLAKDLNERGVPTATGAPWSASTIRSILRNPVYIGTYRWGQFTRSKYNSTRDGQIVVAKKLEAARSRQDMIEITDNHPAIIERELFDRVQIELPKRRSKTSPHSSRTPFALSSLLTCGDCGMPMYGRLRSNGRAFYFCSSALNSQTCFLNCINQDVLLPEIIRTAVEMISNPSFLRAAKDELRRQLADVKATTSSISDLRKQIGTIQGKIHKAQKRLVECDSEFVPVVQAHLRQLAAERAALDEQVRLCGTSAKSLISDMESRTEQLVASLRTLGDGIHLLSPEDAGRELRKLLTSVTVHVEKERRDSGRYKYRLKCVDVTVQS
jgi:site-specific DNA recombinase